MIKHSTYRFLTRTFTVDCYACILLAFTVCGKDDNQPKPETPGAFFLPVTGESAEYILRADNPESGTASISNNGNGKIAEAAIYIIDPATATTTKGLSVTSAININAIGRFTQQNSIHHG